MKPTLYEKLSDLAMWSVWQDTVKAAGLSFAKHPIYVAQDTDDADYERVARAVASCFVDLDGKVRDKRFGARVVNTAALGEVTRMWLESNVEIDFLRRHTPPHSFPLGHVLDIGAGYGRLAVTLAKSGMADSVYCIDAVPISSELCSHYTRMFTTEDQVRVLDLKWFADNYKRYAYFYDLAVNIHSWNECSYEQIWNWVMLIEELSIPYLFTVSHGQLDNSKDRAYSTWGPSNPTEWRSLLEGKYELIAEESLGLSRNPHALWRRK